MAGTNFDVIGVSEEVNNDLLDLLKITLEEYPNKNRLNILQERHEWPVMNQMFKNRREQLTSGTMVSENVVLDKDNQAEMIEPYEVTDYSVPQVTLKLTMPLRLASVPWVLEKTEMLRNREPNRLMNLIDIRRGKANYDMANLLEERAFKAPDNASDTKNIYGFPYYLVPITGAQVTAGTWGHQGANPYYSVDTSTSIGNCLGIDSSLPANALWRSYNDVWDANATATSGGFSRKDVIKICRMHRHLRFRVPYTATQFQDDEMQSYAMFSGELLIEGMESLAQDNNDNLGADLGKYAGSTVVKGTPIQWAEEMDSWTTETLMMINFEYLFPYVFEGDYMSESGPFNESSQHRVFKHRMDLQTNIWTADRRKCGGRIDSVVAAG